MYTISEPTTVRLKHKLEVEDKDMGWTNPKISSCLFELSTEESSTLVDVSFRIHSLDLRLSLIQISLRCSIHSRMKILTNFVPYSNINTLTVIHFVGVEICGLQSVKLTEQTLLPTIKDPVTNCLDVKTRGPHSFQEVPDRVRPGRQFAIISRKPFALPAKLTPYTCPMKRAVIIPAFIPPSHFC
ncbi:hypothetical protein OUZ56_018370 [Daphnia magna]|uniref:Uncharacterized protein n=1 Tax=Daphnia magna TaxID=35525 RepID=A0ABQ9Z8M6_9CRUS|nr:hypothetical protein OUZ56_018370 [Daphnia magna]